MHYILGFSVSKNLVEFRSSEAAKENSIIFSGDMRGGENTFRGENVRAFGACAERSAIFFCQKSLLF